MAFQKDNIGGSRNQRKRARKTLLENCCMGKLKNVVTEVHTCPVLGSAGSRQEITALTVPGLVAKINTCTSCMEMAGPNPALIKGVFLGEHT